MRLMAITENRRKKEQNKIGRKSTENKEWTKNLKCLKG